MAYSDFKTLAELDKAFGMKSRRVELFGRLASLDFSESLQKALDIARELPVKSEKARSEVIVTPILLELRERNHKFFTIYSGDSMNVDEAKGLKGECDFVLAKEIGSFDIAAPILQMVEAKRQDMEAGIPQCAAQMLGGKMLNEQSGIKLDAIYGCVTTGDDWQFLKLENELQIDKRKYYLSELGELLAVFQHILDQCRAQLG